ncbi:alpha/beta hydrolase [Lactiplantibacillus mudanjiangensis]|uniref:Alpha/beta hydrolase fold-3 domain-containing protein n=1 Tax=Lactiplantibacillus mudanjiangensis TaxID=1296538 RepID=A0A660E6T6_9LACO|nr:alpha/beta hydrolase [Lactiplantibacillus mudanjiangensis]VDG23379.1 hypothetical protein [Lactobacillus paracollinoides] [Lactiplantibacillus mudanjiangensis]VDG28739.1 hypothetical protein [Lactobacillus paracollinoides] [Lactiplantibacillus mudanjiangensis]VDG30997.1 hypothetical protein [Lactobacillus paracollinoides] [Lactiplantibacillus mudanjiangensis]
MSTNDSVMQAVTKMRTEWHDNDAKRDANLPTHFPEVQRFDNLSYGPAGVANQLDVYLPTGTTEPIPTVINIHGGGFVYGDKELYQHYCLWWAQNGFAVVNFNYRLAPETIFPGALLDTAAVLTWVKQQAATYHFDLNNLFVTGDSAGGTLTEQALALTTNADYRDLLGVTDPGIHFKGAALNCGLYFLDRPGALDDGSIVGLAYFTPSARKEYAAAIRTEDYLSSAIPPLYVMTANQDFLHDEGIRFDQFLIDHQLPHTFNVYGDEDHTRGHVFHLDMRDPLGQECNLAEKAFFTDLINA